MKIILERPSPLLADELVMCEVVRGRDFGCVWHHHPEVEITLVRRGGTERWVGDRLSPLKRGDLVLMGSDLPHDYRNDRVRGRRSRGVEAVVVQFRPNLLGDDWLDRSGMRPLQLLYQRAAQGLQIVGRTRERAARYVMQIVKAGGLRRVVLLLELLDYLASSKELVEIASPGFLYENGAKNSSDRIGPVCRHIETHLAEPIYISELARKTGLSESAFSRLFKKSTGRTLPAYLNEVRIARACRLLAETDLTVNQIALNCGYPTPAHFQRQFQKLEGRQPLTYREVVRRGE